MTDKINESPILSLCFSALKWKWEEMKKEKEENLWKINE